jgi:GNAT superfamily N-acetyltransferase
MVNGARFILSQRAVFSGMLVALDAVGLGELWRSCDLVASYNDSVTDFRFARAGACSDVLVGEDKDSGIIGSVMVGHDDQRTWLYSVAFSPNSRGSGISRQMVLAAEEWLGDAAEPAEPIA